MSSVWLKGIGRAAITYGIAEFFLQRKNVGSRMKKLGWGALTVYLGGKLVLWGIVALLAVLFFQLADWEFLVKPAGIFGVISFLVGLLLVWQGVTIMKR